jgi:branched-chain amino acid transport system substrate-binding protein
VVNDALRRAELIATNDPSVASIIALTQGVSPASTPSAADSDFVERFTRAFPNQRPDFAAYAFDCANLFALATQQLGDDDPPAIARTLAAISAQGVRCVSFADCVADMEANRQIDYDGASGEIEFDGAGDVTRAVYEVFAFDESGTDIGLDRVTVTA